MLEFFQLGFKEFFGVMRYDQFWFPWLPWHIVLVCFFFAGLHVLHIITLDDFQVASTTSSGYHNDSLAVGIPYRWTRRMGGWMIDVNLWDRNSPKDTKAATRKIEKICIQSYIDIVFLFFMFLFHLFNCTSLYDYDTLWMDVCFLLPSPSHPNWFTDLRINLWACV